MTYTELIDRLFVEYSDETEKIHGEPVSLIYLISDIGEKNGYDSVVCAEDLLEALHAAGVQCIQMRLPQCLDS